MVQGKHKMVETAEGVKTLVKKNKNTIEKRNLSYYSSPNGVKELERGLQIFLNEVGMDLPYFEALASKNKKSVKDKIDGIKTFLQRWDTTRTIDSTHLEKQLRIIFRKNLEEIEWSAKDNNKLKKIKQEIFDKLAEGIGSHKKKNGKNKKSDTFVAATKAIHILSDGKFPMLDTLVIKHFKIDEHYLKKNWEGYMKFKENCDRLMSKHEIKLKRKMVQLYKIKAKEMEKQFSKKIRGYRLLDMALWALAKDQEKKQKGD